MKVALVLWLYYIGMSSLVQLSQVSHQRARSLSRSTNTRKYAMGNDRFKVGRKSRGKEKAKTFEVRLRD